MLVPKHLMLSLCIAQGVSIAKQAKQAPSQAKAPPRTRII